MVTYSFQFALIALCFFCRNRAVLDGIDLDIEGGAGGDNYPYLIRELRRLMDQKTDKKYFITASPQCPYPDDFLGPEKAGSGSSGNYCHL